MLRPYNFDVEAPTGPNIIARGITPGFEKDVNI
jgi:hypothetical protein